MQYTFLENYIITQEKIDKAIKEKSIRKLCHMFYPLSAADIDAAVQAFDPFPVELKTFYEEIGFGNFHCNKEYVNILLDPHSLVHVNGQKYRYSYDKEVERALVEGHLIFFRTHLYQYLTIEKKDHNGKNAIYYKKEKIADSLHSFIKDYDGNRDSLQYDIKHIDTAEIKKGIPQATLRNTFVYTKVAENKQTDKPSGSNASPNKATGNNGISIGSWLLEDDNSFVV
ncbi:MAG: hypothetical protein LBV32_07180 [Tannerellaceae bacterium]|jgi:hypothetical protein|nr:hypothetical protein [Tannerellaceae bacterium]